MQTLRNLTDNNRTLAVFLVTFLILVAAPSLLITKVQSFFWLNFFHSKALDNFFTAYTFVGDGLFSLLLVAFFYFRNRVLAFRILLAFLISGVAAQVLKKILHAPRPMAALGSQAYPYFIDGVTHSGYSSFPSGHTTSAFALALVCCLHTRNFGVQLLLLFLACLVGYSRIYLGQHFLPDVFAGMLLGCVTAIIVYLFVQYPAWLRKERRIEGNVPA
ncbi:phosphatase PAP2 family protein [Niabella beijingensis]|uniref:phosphatase PAP2 family protein n=1 Tax=Niabella beijingensis TaxID=2872700 RepID=UPI001CBB9FE1|nr:phosphatase PAP2 family protein [Niabella beijingensis]MBZ4189937.1 phosphatase PAP2 family protein [Niabella beijingensis]